MVKGELYVAKKKEMATAREIVLDSIMQKIIGYVELNKQKTTLAENELSGMECKLKELKEKQQRLCSSYTYRQR